jgi:UDP-N-acetylmuramate dehydrogenase
MDKPPFEFVIEQCPLGPRTYYHVGGPARLALFPRTHDEAVAAHAWMLRQPEPTLILGSGTNVLISDAGFPGIVLFTTELKELADLGADRWYAASGLDLHHLVRQVMLPNNYEGVGALTGIPGTVGGAIFMNAGTVNGSTCPLLESADLLDADGLRTLPITPSMYSYRSQSFCGRETLVLGGLFRFKTADRDQREIYDHYMQRRLDSQPQGFCCGSVFKNPPGQHAGRLIEACGLKGARYGGAVISPKHANFIMNERDATFEEILHLFELAKSTVFERFGVALEEEVRIIR